MNISPKTAENIVAAMKDIFHHDLNYINQEGVIIASTNPKRVGTEHGGAKIVLKTRKSLTIDTNEQFSGSKKGMNIPIYFNNDVVGIIGITGDKKEVENYGEILGKMTEILIKEEYLQGLFFAQKERNRHLISSILSASASEDISKTFIDFDETLCRFAIVGKIKNEDFSYKQMEGFYDILYDVLENDEKEMIYYVFENEIMLLLEEDDETQINTILEQLISYAKQKRNIDVVFGVGSKASCVCSIKTSFKEATDALEWTERFSQNKIESYDNMTLGILFSALNQQGIHDFYHKILGDISKKELLEFEELVSTYGENNRSIAKCADALFIHKNTLQYRISKLEKYTGYDIREIDDYLIIKLAFISYTISKQSN